MKLTHHATEPFDLDRGRIYKQSLRPKPGGLWLSVDDDWRRWVEGEGLDWLDGRTTYVATLTDQVDILTISTPEELDELTKLYRGPSRNEECVYHMDWPLIATKYAGILIAPYLWERRMDIFTSWYYPWDCASACVWDLTAIDCFERERAITEA